MNLNVWRLIGVICLGIWLLVLGWVAAIISIISLAAHPPNSNLKYWSFNVFGYMLLKDIAPGYILLGVGPASGFALLMNKLGHPLGRTQLIGLGICAIIPFAWLLLLVY